MAGASRRTSICLTAVAIIFIIVIIILCVIPDPCRERDPRPECHVTGSAKSSLTTPKDVLTDDPTSTPSSTTSTVSSDVTSTELSTPRVSSSSEPSSSIATDYYDDYEDTSDNTTDEVTRTTHEVSSTTTSGPKFTNGTSETTDVTEDEDETINGTTVMHEATNATTYDYGTTNMTEAWTTSTPEMSNETKYEADTTNTSESVSTTTESVSTTNDTTFEATSEVTETTNTTFISTTTSPETTTTTETTVTSTTTEIPTIMVSDEVCNTKTCKEVAARMLDIMDHGNIDPCQDFYQYSCGGVLDDLFLKPENPQLPANILIKKALSAADRNDTDLKELLVVYDSCLNYSKSYAQEDRIREIRKVFESLGYRFNPLVLKTIDKSDYPDFDENFDLSVALARMMKKHVTPFFDFMIDVDDEDPTQFVYKMTLPAFNSPFTQNLAKQVCYNQYKKKVEAARLRGDVFNVTKHYADYVNCTTVGDGLKARLERMIEGVTTLKLTDYVTNSTHNSQLIRGAAVELDFMLKDISEILPSPPEIRKRTLKKDYKKYTLRQLDDGSVFDDSPIKFDAFFKELIGKPLNPDYTFIQVYFKEVLNEIFTIMSSSISNPAMLQNSVLLLWTERIYGDLVKPIGPEPGSQEYCFNAVSSLMDEYVTYLYLKELPQKDELQRQMKHMIRQFKAQVESQLEHSSSKIQTELQDKMQQMKGEVAHLEEVRFAMRYNRYKMPVATNAFVKNYQNLMEHYRDRLYQLQNKDPSEHQALWSLLQFAYKANGVTSYALNKFLIPHATMSPPFYYGEEVPGYINYAGIGHMIAHELMHSFDSTGMEFSDSHRRKLEPDDLDKRVVFQTECLGEELGATFSRNSSSGTRYLYTLHSGLSLNELLADSAATKLAWDTYKKELGEAATRHISTTRAPYRTLPPSRRRRRDLKEISYAVEGLRSRAKRQASLPPDDSDDFEGPPLPFLTNFTALQLYYIKTAQNQCSATSEINIVDVMEREHLPPNLRINLMMRHDPLFAKAFSCPFGSNMRPNPENCQFDPVGADKLTSASP